jgi:hypothetical protein
MIAQFRRKRTCFENILSLAQADVAKGIWRIEPTFLKTRDKFLPSKEEQHALLSPDRWNLYRGNFHCAGIDRPNGGVMIGQEAVSFLAEPRGLAGSGLIKMYIWSQKPLGPLKPSLDHLESQHDLASPVTFIRQFDTQWYLQLEID